MQLTYHLILTLDYELFGNGTGCLRNCVISPTKACLLTLTQYQAGLAVFADATEFLALKRYHRVFGEGIQEVEEQLQSAVSAGHSLQLHLHPQWMGAHYSGLGWDLDMGKWRIGDLSESDIRQCVTEGLTYLKSLLPHGKAKVQDHCKVFRAGGWAIQPSQTVLKVLKSEGIDIDSTIAPGAYNPSKGDWYDFRNSPKLPFWNAENHSSVVINHSSDNILEVPITTAEVGRLNHAKALKTYRAVASLPEGCVGTYDGPNSDWETLKGKVSKLWRMGRVMLDFSTMPGWMLVEITKRYIKEQAEVDSPVPIVAIGHNKNFTEYSNINLRYWLDWISSQDNICFSSYAQWHQALKTG